MYTYSIIIPHHNSPDLLFWGINTIPERNDIQIIVVDDDSDPSIVDFDNFAAKNRRNVEILYNKDRKGAGHARNLGLEKAKGKWLIFADADDYFSENAFEIFDRYKDTTFSIVYFGVDSLFADTGERASRHNNYMRSVNNVLSLNSEDSKERIRLTHCVPWGKMIRKSIVDQYKIRFDEVWYSNDVMFGIKLGWYSKNISVDSDIVYIVTVSTGSLTKRNNLNNYMTRFEVNLRRNQFFRQIGKSNYQVSLMNYYLSILKYGFGPWLKATKKLFKYRGNLFIGCSNWVKTIIKIKKETKVMKKYFID